MTNAAYATATFGGETVTSNTDDAAVTVTDSSLCVFDRYPSTSDREFRLLFTPDVKQWPAYKLTASNPGQFYYNVLYAGEGTSVTIEMNIPYPFVTQGAMPVHAYGSVTPYVSDAGLDCFMPGDEGVAYGELVALADYSAENLDYVDDGDSEVGFGDYIVVSIPAPLVNGFVYANIHLDYGLKGGEDRYLPLSNGDGTDAVDSLYPTQVLIADHGEYVFGSEVDGQIGSDSVFSLNEFKKIPGVGGFVHTASGDPVVGAVVQLGIPGSVTKAAATSLQAVTDEDGWYMIEYKHVGKPQVYRMDVWDEDGNPIASDVEVPLKGNAYAEVSFTE